jgi:rhamnogalacturonyl hydrolase YesR
MSRCRNAFLFWLPVALAFCALSVGAEPAPASRVFERDAILTMMLKANAYQQAHPVMKENDRNWERGTWYTGVMAAYRATGDERFLQQAREWGKRHAWQVGTERCGANKLFCVQTWLELYSLQKDRALIQPAIDHLASDLPNSPGGARRWYLEGDRSYADSLYGSPALAMLAQATGLGETGPRGGVSPRRPSDDKEYLEILHAFWDDLCGELLDREAGLFYRDRRFIGQTTPAGKKILWSRGNGWVIGGLVRVLDHLPPDEPRRAKYVDLLRTMAAALAQCQGEDGLWSANLADPDDVPGPESSGTGFFLYGIAWGVRHQLLDEATYLPVLRKGWTGLTACLSPEGKVLHGQPVGDRPAEAKREATHEYVTGTFLLAAAEMYRLADKFSSDTARLPAAPVPLLAAPMTIITVSENPHGAPQSNENKTDPAAELASSTPQRFPLFGSFDEMARASDPVLPPVRAVTRGPKFHWFGYYDKFQLDPGNRYLLCMEVDFEHRLPQSNEAVKIGMVDLADGDKWIELGESRAWCWQQGCMLQWRPGSDREVVWNDRDGERFVCRVLDVKTRQVRTLPRAIASIRPDGKLAVCEDFSRIWNFRPGYAYAGIPDKFADQPAPAEIGVWRMDLDTGESQLIVSVADLAKIPYPKQSPRDRHYVNHLSWNPDGKRFLMFNRWSGAGMPTRVFTADADGRDLRLLSARDASHWTWRDPQHVLIWASNAYRLYRDDGSGESTETLWQAPNGHQTYVSGTRDEWIVTDTYPLGAQREQIVYLFHVSSRRFVLLGRFPSTYQGEWRCDAHPRVSRDGKLVIIDSPHGGNGRQQYVIDISPVLADAQQGTR